MHWVWGAALVGFTSAVIPIVSIEAYLAALSAQTTLLWLLAVSAALGQSAGKVVLYYLSVRATDLPWLRRRRESEKWQRSYAVWHSRAENHPWRTAGLVFLSALISVPPLYLLTLIAGQLRFPLGAFVGAVFTGRLLRFAAMLGSLGWLLG